jgi:hypothetical protein
MQPISVPWPNESSVGAKLTKGSKASIDLREEVRSQVAYMGTQTTAKVYQPILHAKS